MNEAKMTHAELIAKVRGAPLALPQKELATASDDYLNGFQAGATAQLDGILAALTTPKRTRATARTW